MNATIFSYKVDAEHDSIAADVLLDSGVRLNIVFRESQYLPSANWTDTDLCAAVVKATEDASDAALVVRSADVEAQNAKAKTDLDAKLQNAKAATAASVAALGAPPMTVDDDLASVRSGLRDAKARVERYAQLEVSLVTAAAEAAKIQATNEAAAELARNEAAEAARETRIADAVIARLGLAPTASAAPATAADPSSTTSVGA